MFLFKLLHDRQYAILGARTGEESLPLALRQTTPMTKGIRGGRNLTWAQKKMKTYSLMDQDPAIASLRSRL
jgi:hypothetical protein